MFDKGSECESSVGKKTMVVSPKGLDAKMN
jgi:hypothetical protein